MSKETKFDPSDYLGSDDELIEHLAEVLKNGSEEEYKRAIEKTVRAIKTRQGES